MRSRFLALVFVIMGSAFTTSQAPSSQIGAGGRSCGEWLTVHASEGLGGVKASMLLSWVQGYLVGAADVLTVTAPTLSDTLSKAFGQTYGTSASKTIPTTRVFQPPDPEANAVGDRNWRKQNSGEHHDDDHQNNEKDSILKRHRCETKR